MTDQCHWIVVCLFRWCSNYLCVPTYPPWPFHWIPLIVKVWSNMHIYGHLALQVLPLQWRTDTPASALWRTMRWNTQSKCLCRTFEAAASFCLCCFFFFLTIYPTICIHKPSQNHIFLRVVESQQVFYWIAHITWHFHGVPIRACNRFSWSERPGSSLP